MVDVALKFVNSSIAQQEKIHVNNSIFFLIKNFKLKIILLLPKPHGPFRLRGGRRSRIE